MTRSYFLGAALAAVLMSTAFLPAASLGAPVLLQDDNSSMVVDPSSPFAGAFQWQIDGVNQLKRQWFWYRTGAGPEASIDTLLQGPSGATDTNFDGFDDTYFVQYSGADFTLDLRYSLMGGTAGSEAGGMVAELLVTNTSPGALFFDLFAYSDFDLDGTILNDELQFTNSNAVRQTDGQKLLETAYTPVPAHHEGTFSGFTLASLMDGGPTTLSDLPSIGDPPIGPSDLTWSLQWTRKIDPGQSMPISLGTTVSIPEPSTIALLVTGGLGLGLWRRRRQARA